MIKRILITTTIVTILTILLIAGIGKLLQSYELEECIKWQNWAREYPNFYMAQWQEEQCSNYDIKIEAPVNGNIEIDEPEYTEIFATIYAYSSEVEQTDSDPYTMASGNKVYDGAIACPEFVAFGTKVEVKEKMYTCEDRMGERYRNKNYFDIWMTTKEEAKEWGIVGAHIKIYNK